MALASFALEMKDNRVAAASPGELATRLIGRRGTFIKRTGVFSGRRPATGSEHIERNIVRNIVDAAYSPWRGRLARVPAQPEE
jgi:hypothetical protein